LVFGGLHGTQADFTDIFTQTHATAQCFVLGMTTFVTMTQLKRAPTSLVLGRFSINNLTSNFEIFTNILEITPHYILLYSIRKIEQN